MSKTIGSVIRGAEAFFLNSIKKDILYITSDTQNIEQISDNIKLVNPEVKVIILPEWDCLPYDRVSPSKAVLKERMNSLVEMINQSPQQKIIIASTASIIRLLPPIDQIKSSIKHLKVGDHIGHDLFTRYLNEIGFERYSIANEQGEYAARGGIIDIITDDSGTGFRIDFFGDILESIKVFDVTTQLSTQIRLEELKIFPASEVIFTASTTSLFQKQYIYKFGVNTDPLLESISSGRKYMGMEHWMTLFYDKTNSIFDYLSSDTSIIIDDSHGVESFKEAFENVLDYYNARLELRSKESLYNPIPIEDFYLTDEKIKKYIENFDYIITTPYYSQNSNIDITTFPPFHISAKLQNTSVYEMLKSFIDTKELGGKSYNFSKLVFGCFTLSSRDRLAAILKDHDFEVKLLNSWNDISSIGKGVIGVLVFGLERGFIQQQICLASEQDLLGERKDRKAKKRKNRIRSIEEINGLSIGDYVVHIEHGIGMFSGVEEIKVNEIAHDFIKLIYLGEDKLYVPVENFELITRYSGNDTVVQLDKLGSLAWQRRKASAKERIKLAAEKLLSLAAARKLKVAPILEPMPDFYETFCSNFPYVETEDQLKAIDDVLFDLSQERPTDRLVCGDVGFGKTEVVMRAAAASVGGLNHCQVAVIVPTTLLARQHYKNFCDRFSDLPVKIGQLSKFCTSKEMKNVKNGIETGEIDIVIGTHALLSKDINFRNLGLIIIDEEQHFGVGQKEKLKEIKNNAHIITLSATPIPRTMQMSLAGIKDLSIIATPPMDRLPVHTVVMPFDPVVLRDAIMRERNRNGRVFYITPRIQYIDELQRQISKIVPEIKIGVAHGKMTSNELDKTMNDFYDGKFDMLLSTTIIESGLDINIANTIIIDRAEMFGLAQLYQIRGRVGRSKVRAYAYLITKENRLSDSAKKRLDVLQSLDYSGAGLSVATHDMDIRGYGNLVGEEQSGHVKEVGIELYQSMLSDAVDNMSSNKIEEDNEWSPILNIGIPVQLPNEYIGDVTLKLSIYKKLSSLNSESEIEDYALELIDRFGSLPIEAEGLIDVMKLKVAAKLKDVSKIDCGDKAVVLSFKNSKPLSHENLISFISKSSDAKIRPDGRLLIARMWKSDKDKINGLKKIITQL